MWSSEAKKAAGDLWLTCSDLLQDAGFQTQGEVLAVVSSQYRSFIGHPDGLFHQFVEDHQ